MTTPHKKHHKSGHKHKHKHKHSSHLKHLPVNTKWTGVFNAGAKYVHAQRGKGQKIQRISYQGGKGGSGPVIPVAQTLGYNGAPVLPAQGNAPQAPPPSRGLLDALAEYADAANRASKSVAGTVDNLASSFGIAANMAFSVAQLRAISDSKERLHHTENGTGEVPTAMSADTRPYTRQKPRGFFRRMTDRVLRRVAEPDDDEPDVPRPVLRGGRGIRVDELGERSRTRTRWADMTQSELDELEMEQRGYARMDRDEGPVTSPRHPEADHEEMPSSLLSRARVDEMGNGKHVRFGDGKDRFLQQYQQIGRTKGAMDLEPSGPAVDTKGKDKVEVPEVHMPDAGTKVPKALPKVGDPVQPQASYLGYGRGETHVHIHVNTGGTVKTGKGMAIQVGGKGKRGVLVPASTGRVGKKPSVLALPEPPRFAGPFTNHVGTTGLSAPNRQEASGSGISQSERRRLLQNPFPVVNREIVPVDFVGSDISHAPRRSVRTAAGPEIDMDFGQVTVPDFSQMDVSEPVPPYAVSRIAPPDNLRRSTRLQQPRELQGMVPQLVDDFENRQVQLSRDPYQKTRLSGYFGEVADDEFAQITKRQRI